MSEPTVEQLSRFTPHTGKLDRNALLFEAGRASARPNRGWMGLSAMLASTQVLALVLVWRQSEMASNPGRQTIDQVAAATPHSPTGEHVVQTLPAESHIWSVRHQVDDKQHDSQLASVVAPKDSEPILRAFGPLPSSIVN